MAMNAAFDANWVEWEFDTLHSEIVGTWGVEPVDEVWDMLGSLQGLLVAVPLLALARRRGRVRSVTRTEVPFGPFLALGALEALVIGSDTLSAWAVSLLSQAR